MRLSPLPALVEQLTLLETRAETDPRAARQLEAAQRILTRMEGKILRAAHDPLRVRNRGAAILQADA